MTLSDTDNQRKLIFVGDCNAFGNIELVSREDRNAFGNYKHYDNPPYRLYDSRKLTEPVLGVSRASDNLTCVAYFDLCRIF